MSQTLSLREQLRALERLQELDLKIDRLKKNRDALPSGLKTIDVGVAKLQTALATKNAALGEIEKGQRQTQAARDLNQDRLTRANTKLESVQNSQEFQAAQKELEQLRKLNASLDEQSKKSTADAAIIQKDVADLTAQLEKLNQERAAQASQLSGQDSQAGAEIESLLLERGKHTDGVDKRTLTQYDRIRGARAGLGIVPAIAGRCKGCNMMVPPQLYNEIQKVLQLYQCPSCNRYLYAQTPAPESRENQ